MKPEEINERFAKAAGIKQRSWITKGMDGKLYGHSSPDFCADPLLVLEVMMKDKRFIDRILYNRCAYIGMREFLESYITDKTGRLATWAAEYLETEGGVNAV